MENRNKYGGCLQTSRNKSQKWGSEPAVTSWGRGFGEDPCVQKGLAGSLVGATAMVR